MARPVPRYTSYPTAPQFGSAVNETVFARWLTAIPAHAEISLYLHVPYCVQLCWYCGCHTRAATDYHAVARYRDALLAEIATVRRHIGHRARVTHLHWGGGTPTVLRAEDLKAIDSGLHSAFDVASDAEIAVEIDPRSLPDATVAALAECGVNRVSFGVQDFDPRVQAAIGRIQSFETTQSAVERLRRAGVTSVNIDLIYGLPLQTEESLRRTIRQAVDLGPDRIALFGYAHVPWMKKLQRMIREVDLPGPDARWAQARAAADLLAGLGYRAVGIDHFARPGDSLAEAAAAGTLRRNFQGYTTDAASYLIGLGASAISSLPAGYAQNAADVKAWLDRAETGRLATARGVALTDDDLLRRDAIERVMCDLAVDLDAVAARHGTDSRAFVDTFPTLRSLAEIGIATLDGPVVRVAAEARPLARLVAAAFDTYLDAGAGRHSAAV